MVGVVWLKWCGDVVGEMQLETWFGVVKIVTQKDESVMVEVAIVLFEAVVVLSVTLFLEDL